MKLVFIIINKSPITLNWVINLAGKSNTAVRVFPFPEGALQRKRAARLLLRSRGRLCSLRQLVLCGRSVQATSSSWLCTWKERALGQCLKTSYKYEHRLRCPLSKGLSSNMCLFPHSGAVLQRSTMPRLSSRGTLGCSQARQEGVLVS